VISVKLVSRAHEARYLTALLISLKVRCSGLSGAIMR